MQEFETSLRTAPNRFNGLYGAARAARLAAEQSNLAADRKKAKTYYGKLVVLSRQGDSARPEIAEAKAYLAGVNVRESASRE